MVMRIGYSDTGEYDEDRNFTYSAKGTYGTSGWMSRKEMAGVLELVADLHRYQGIVLGMLERKAVCVPEKTRLNSNLAVYGASGSMKTRSFCMNRILQGVSRGESLVICDPKSELYEKSSEYLRDKGYTVRVFNLVSPENSDSWNCLCEVEGQELMAQLFVDVIIKNTTGGGKGDHFWDSAEMNLLKALVLYVDKGYPPENRNMGQVYQLITLNSETALNSLFEVLPINHPAKAPYSLFKQASDSVRSGVIIGLGSRLQVFQSELIKKITARDEIDLELPGQKPCAYFLVTSDQDSTFDFLASLFLSFVFIKLVRYADRNCEGGRLPVPVHVLGEELTACGTIPDLSRRLSVIRSRNISMSCVFQNLAGLQNRYPLNLWQEILGNCDVQLFLGCTDPLTAEYVSSRTGLASVAVSSKSKQLGTWRISNYTPEYRETSGVGKRPSGIPPAALLQGIRPYPGVETPGNGSRRTGTSGKTGATEGNDKTGRKNSTKKCSQNRNKTRRKRNCENTGVRHTAENTKSPGIRTGKVCRIFRHPCRDCICGQRFHHVLKPDCYGTARFRAVK